MTALADLKARVDLAEIVGRYVTLTRRNRDWWGCCPFHDDSDPSFKVDPERQNYRCFGCDAHGDALDFLAQIENLDVKGAADRLRDLVGAREHRRPSSRPAARPSRSAGANRELAQEIWRQAHPLCGCESCAPGRRYLTSRGITRWPEALFFHAACPFIDYEDERKILRYAPAILAPVNCHRTVLVVGIWRIRLTTTGEKLERRGLGPSKGNASRLFWADGDELALAEGCEDALAFAQLTGMPTWAALSADGMAQLILRSRFRQVTIVQDNDQPDQRGRRRGPDAAQRLAHRLRAESRDVEIVAAVGHKDANEVLIARGAP